MSSMKRMNALAFLSSLFWTSGIIGACYFANKTFPRGTFWTMAAIIWIGDFAWRLLRVRFKMTEDSYLGTIHTLVKEKNKVEERPERIIPAIRQDALGKSVRVYDLYRFSTGSIVGVVSNMNVVGSKQGSIPYYDVQIEGSGVHRFHAGQCEFIQ